MKPLILFLFAGGLSAGVAAWQQQSINRVGAAIAKLSEQIIQTRSITDAEQAAVATARARLNQLQAEREAVKKERAAVATAEAPTSATPAQENWWPEDRPYFYLAKKYLSNVRFRSRPQPIEHEVDHASNAHVAQPKVADYWATASDYVLIDFPLFNGAELNPGMAVLLGMSDEEVSAMNELHGRFLSAVRDVEVARIQWVEPPESVGDGRTKVVARLPRLRSELQPLLDNWERDLEQTLGPSRAKILQAQAEDFFRQHLDDLGSATREFLRDDGKLNLWVRYNDQWGQHFSPTTFNLERNRSANGQDWQYGHLFGPGAPGELK